MKKLSLFSLFVFSIFFSFAQSNSNKSGNWKIEYETKPHVNSNYGPNQFNFMLKKINLISLNSSNTIYQIQPLNQSASIVYSNANIINNKINFYFFEANSFDTMFVNIPINASNQDTLIGTIISIHGELKIKLLKSIN